MSRVGIFGQISYINDHLYLSGAGCIKPEKIKEKQISFIVNATVEEPNINLPGIDYLRVRIEDNPYARLDAYFDQVADKIKATKDRGGKSLVHCVAGVSRSASLVIVYLIKYERMTLKQAYQYVKGRRPVVRPNVGFWQQMVNYEKKLRGTTSVQMVMTPQCDLPIPDLYCDDFKRKVSRDMPLMNKSSYTPSSAYMTSKRRGYSASSLRPSSSPRRSTSPVISTRSLVPLFPKYSLFSPAPSRSKPRESLFSIYSSAPRHTFFSAF